MKPQFLSVKAEAANLGCGAASYTEEMFQADFPQFFNAGGVCHVPPEVLREFLRQASVAVQTDKWDGGRRFAAGLYAAHLATLYLRTYAPSTATPSQAAASGALVGVVKSAALGDSSVSYDTAALTKATEDWGDLNATQYGQMLATRARLAGLGGSYVI